MGNYDDARLGLTQFLREFSRFGRRKDTTRNDCDRSKEVQEEAEGIFGKLRQTHQNDIRSAARDSLKPMRQSSKISKAVQLLSEELKR